MLFRLPVPVRQTGVGHPNVRVGVNSYWLVLVWKCRVKSISEVSIIKHHPLFFYYFHPFTFDLYHHR